MKGREDKEAAQVEAANKMVKDTLAGAPSSVVDPELSAEEAQAQEKAQAQVQEERQEAPPAAPAKKAPKFVKVPPSERRFAYSFAKLEVEGEFVDFTVDRIVSEEEAEDSPNDRPLFHGVYVTTFGEEEPRYLILPAWFQLMEYMRDQEKAGLLAKRAYRVTFLEKVQGKKGDVIRLDFHFADLEG